MGVWSEVRRQLGLRFEVLLPHLNERQRRLALATEARLLGHGGVRKWWASARRWFVSACSSWRAVMIRSRVVPGHPNRRGAGARHPIVIVMEVAASVAGELGAAPHLGGGPGRG